MIEYSIERATGSGLFDRVFVSTDDAAIAEVARSSGAEVPFVRPAALADDVTGVLDVMAHAVAWMHTEQLAPRAVCCIYATAPFIDPADLRRGSEEMDGGRWDYAFAVTDFAAPIFRAFAARAEGGVEMFFPEHFHTRSQDLPVALHDAGQFCWGTPTAWLERRPVFGHASCPIVVPRWRVQDIDTPEDWQRAEWIARVLARQED
jgi:N-acylneuraminate cytidylyltransferase